MIQLFKKKKKLNIVYKLNFINLLNLYIVDKYNKWKKYILYNIKFLYCVEI